eukprot:3414539-Alexandrium_andersonii.AAC.1
MDPRNRLGAWAAVEYTEQGGCGKWLAGPLEGPGQNSQRAELTGVIEALRRIEGPCVVVLGNLEVCKGSQTLRGEGA